MNRIETIVVSENRKTANLYKYIKSKDVREYLKENNYQFSLLQAAYLIYHDWSTPLSVKHKDYESLIREYEDCGFRGYVPSENSLHKAIRKIVDFEKKYLDLFYKEEGFYSYKIGKTDISGKVYEDLNKVKENIETYVNRGIELNIIPRNPYINIHKQYLGSNRTIDVLFNTKMEPVSVSAYTDEEHKPDFQFCYEALPLPFKEGDIVKDAALDETDEVNHPMIIIDKNYEAIISGKGHGKIDERYDIEAIRGCSIENGKILQRSIPAMYMEYFKPNKWAEYRCLQMIQDMIKGNVDLDDFLYAYPMLLNEIENNAKHKDHDMSRLRRYFL